MTAGRPTSYKPSYNKQAEKLCLLGATDVELADFFEVAESTIYKWKLDFPKFSESIKKGKQIADIKVTEKLFKRACGYGVKEETYEKVLLSEKVGDDITGEAYKKKVVKKDMAPDTTAAIFWLKNRQPDKWREKKIVENHNRDIIVDSEKDKEALEDV